MTARFATNKTKLARCLGISRTLLYEYMRLPDAPAPCVDGRWSLTQYRKFIASHGKQIKATTEKEALLIRKLQLQCEREGSSLGQERMETHKKILDQLTAEFVGILHLVKTEIFKMRTELSPKFTGLADARAIYKAWETREREMFKTIAAQLNKRTGAQVTELEARPVANLLRFDRACENVESGG